MCTVLQEFSSSFFFRFKVEQKLDFKQALYSLNITEIFSGGCDLSGITGNMTNSSCIIMLICFLSDYVLGSQNYVHGE